MVQFISIKFNSNSNWNLIELKSNWLEVNWFEFNFKSNLNWNYIEFSLKFNWLELFSTKFKSIKSFMMDHQWGGQGSNTTILTIQNLNISKSSNRRKNTNCEGKSIYIYIVGELHYKEDEVLQCHKRSCIEESYSKINKDTQFSPSTTKGESLGTYWNTSLLIVGMVARVNFMFFNT